ncbi:MAG: glycosyltransferase family 2 protein [Candidatus Micrarchaeota archaeon]|nr:glycosyltransferase family 2 protein [Candidatus Micrarchaeota archaeon]MDE1847555.1 glycosyltransferase family 2 protein [Candidatus Micrarchaeota archaeon]MDE1864272.1 glycosyltransferase family 2 protein [Candidatus Micrarchaeota archaeon]
MKEPFVAIIVANYNGKSYLYKKKPILEQCLTPLLKTDYKNYRIIVADDCSTDDSLEYLRRKRKNIDLTKTEQNGKFARNNNNGIRYAIRKYNPDYIVLLSNDVIAKERNWLRKMVKLAESEESAGLIGPKLVYPNGRIQNAGIPFNTMLHTRGQTDIDRPEYSKVERMEAVVAVAVMIKRKVIDKIGLLDENFRGTFEDIDFCLRVNEAGFSIMYDGEVRLIHLHSFTNNILAKHLQNKEEGLYNEQRNCSYFILKHFNGARIVPAFIWLLMRLIVVGGGHGIVGIGNFKIEGPIIKKLGISIKAWSDSVKFYNSLERVEKR